jgi:hypothetical protein
VENPAITQEKESVGEIGLGAGNEINTLGTDTPKAIEIFPGCKVSVFRLGEKRISLLQERVNKI